MENYKVKEWYDSNVLRIPYNQNDDGSITLTKKSFDDLIKELSKIAVISIKKGGDDNMKKEATKSTKRGTPAIKAKKTSKKSK